MAAITVKNDSRTEFTEKKSVFIGQAFFVTSEDEAKARIAGVRAENPQATHVCYAYSLRAGSLQRFSDDGEPSSTAGMPILHVINAQGLVDTLITVTRYFGGILLGAGGLVRAYSSSAADAVEAAGKTEIIGFTEFSLAYAYDLHNSVERALSQAGATVVSRDFAEKVTVSASLPSADFASLSARLSGDYHKYIDIRFIAETFGRRTDK